MAGEFIGKVESIQGAVQVRVASGELRPLALGDPLYEGDVVITGEAGKLAIRVAEGGVVYIDPGQRVAMTDELPLSRFAEASAPEPAVLDPLAQAVLDGSDLDAMTEATAAGPAGAAGDGGHGFVQLLRVTEFATSPIGLTTTGLSPNPLLTEQTLPLAEDQAPLDLGVPALVVGSNVSDTNDQSRPAAHVVDTSAFGPDGAIDGDTSNDILIGDVGGTGLQPGQTGNIVFVLDTSGSMSSEIQFTNADGNTSTITRLEALILSTKDALTQLANSGAEDVRVHIVQFGTTAQTLGTFDVMDPDQLQAAFAALDAPPADTGFTNYEAGLTLAQRWIEGGSFITPVDRIELAIVDANRNEGGSQNDRAYVLGSAGTPLALVSGWGASTSDLRDAGHGDLLAFGVEGGASDSHLDAGEVLRFDFGAFADFDGAGPYQNTGSFNGSPTILATSFELRSDDDAGIDTEADTAFAYLITFIDGTSEDRAITVSGTTVVTLQGTSANAGKEIAHIAFSVQDGDSGSQGQVSLLSVTQTAVSGALPGADINRVVFVSDSEPNYALDDAGLPVAVEDQTAIHHVLGIADNSNEVDGIENTSSRLGQAFTIESIGINISSLAPGADPVQLPESNELSQLEGSGGSATDIVTANDLAEVIGQIAGATQSPSPVGDDAINGGAGKDLIFGDAPFTDTLAASQSLTLSDGAGWNVFAALEAGAGADTDWSRSDTLNYLANHTLELSAESGRAGGNDRIDAGSGDDLVFGQDGNDLIIGGAGDDVLWGGSGSDTFVFRLADVGAGRGDLSARDTIADFSAGSGGDVLDLRDLLQGEETALTAMDLAAYLSFSSDGSHTSLSISRNGDGVVDQRIQLSGVDLTSGNTYSDASIIQTLLNGNQLVKD